MLLLWNLQVRAEAVVDHPAAALIAARTAQLLIVVSRGRGAVRSLPFGSISQYLPRSSACTVAVVHSGHT
ncbi:universal stress protein [Actinoplanes sp. NPDC026670]|uniref:universal stress protein n=1 Tax=Actinoplanes sp. NPDC026670 TaxID=3154700 RepID=UPI0033F28384